MAIFGLKVSQMAGQGGGGVHDESSKIGVYKEHILGWTDLS